MPAPSRCPRPWLWFVADRQRGQAAAVTESEVRHEDWGGRELLQETFSRVAFVEVDLSEVVTEGSVFEECTFRGVKFNVSSHTSTAFLNCTFTRCTFVAPVRLTVNIADGRGTAFPLIAIGMLMLVLPGTNVSVPLLAT